MLGFPDQPFKYELRGQSDLVATSRGQGVGILMLVACGLMLVVVIGNGMGLGVAILAFFASVLLPLLYILRREQFAITADRVEYERRWPLSAHRATAQRASLLGIKLVQGGVSPSMVNTASKPYEVQLLLSGDGLPSSVKLFESFRQGAARAAAQQISQHLSLPLDANTRNWGPW